MQLLLYLVFGILNSISLKHCNMERPSYMYNLWIEHIFYLVVLTIKCDISVVVFILQFDMFALFVLSFMYIKFWFLAA